MCGPVRGGVDCWAVVAVTPDDLARIEAGIAASPASYTPTEVALVAALREAWAERDARFTSVVHDCCVEAQDARAALARVEALCDDPKQPGDAVWTDDLRSALAGPTPTEGDDRA